MKIKIELHRHEALRLYDAGFQVYADFCNCLCLMDKRVGIEQHREDLFAVKALDSLQVKWIEDILKMKNPVKCNHPCVKTNCRHRKLHEAHANCSATECESVCIPLEARP